MEICEFEIAKKLKEKGFPQRSDYFNYSSYYDWDGLRKIHSLSNASVWFDPNISRDNIYFAPTISQVLKWLREEKKIEAVVSGQEYIGGPYFADVFTKDGLMNQAEPYPKWEQAALAGIEYVIDNLI